MDYTDDAINKYYQTLSHGLIRKEGKEHPQLTLLLPSEIKEQLDQYVIGQDEAKKVLAVAAWNRLLALNNMLNHDTDESFYFEKCNLMMLGGTGCGKTYLIQTLARVCGLPCIIEDITAFTANGYVGRDINSIIYDLINQGKQQLIQESIENQETIDWEVFKIKLEHSIIYLDEFDKIRCSDTTGKDVNGRSVQEGILKMVEGTIVGLNTAHFGSTIETKNMLFILGGAFVGLNDIQKLRANPTSIGFTAKTKTELVKIPLPQDLIDYGIIAELIGRAGTIIKLDDLDREALRRIFTEPKRSLMSQVIAQFKSYDMVVDFTDEAIEYIIDEAIKLKLGARGLRIVTERLLTFLQYTLPDLDVSSWTITKQNLLGGFDE